MSIQRLIRTPLTFRPLRYNAIIRTAKCYSTLIPPPHLSKPELELFTTLSSSARLKEIASLEVEDTSGGCGSMYAINVVSSAFKDMNMVARHRLVNDAVKGIRERDNWHGCVVKCFPS